ncbi:MAG: sigma factor-like helix-turn-helix DNA-binding protein [Micromonosporaceae bacterium]
MLVNAHISRWRARSRRGEKLTADPPALPVVDVELGRCEDRDQLRAALATLSPRQRAVVVLRYHEDLSVNEPRTCSSAPREQSRPWRPGRWPNPEPTWSRNARRRDT